METQDRPSPLTPRLENLAAITAEDVLLAYLATNKTKYCQLTKLNKALSLYVAPAAVLRALETLSARALVVIPVGARCMLTESGLEAAASRFGVWLDQGWASLCAAALPALALGLDLHSEQTKDYLSKKENLESLTLGRAYGFVAAGATPNRSRVRSLLLRVLLAARFPECAAALEEAHVENYKPDALAQALLLGLAGLKQGSVTEAERILALRAVGVGPEEKVELPEAIVRASLSRGSLNGAAVIQRESDLPRARPSLPVFADAVRALAQTMETLPFSGRVAIAEVYDAGLARGMAFGALEEFKSRVAEACRAGLIDLERYDIAGALDPMVRDRSRTPLGRDERHFIVNEWG
jgi:hypothetical protein